MRDARRLFAKFKRFVVKRLCSILGHRRQPERKCATFRSSCVRCGEHFRWSSIKHGWDEGLPLDTTYDLLECLLRAGAIKVIDGMLEALLKKHLTSLHEDTIIALLTMTLPVKNHLPSRGAFFVEARAILGYRGLADPKVLHGLD